VTLAQVIKKVQEQQKKTGTLQADFRQEKELALMAKPEVSSGTFIYSRPSNVLNDMALNNGFVPAYNPVLDDPAVQEDPIMAGLAPTMEYSIISDVPDPIRLEQVQLLEQVILDASDLDGKLAAAEEKMNAVLAQRDSWPILERRYKHDDLMIPNQP